MRNEHTVIIDQAKCIGCSLCIKDCPSHVLSLKNKQAHVDNNKCLKCGHCVSICPVNAIEISGFEDETYPIDPKQLVNAEHLMSTLKSRRTIRQFHPTKVSDDILEQLLMAGQYTHSAQNKQDVSYFVMENSKDELEAFAVKKFRRLKRFADIFSSNYRNIPIDDQFFFKGAPLVIIIKAASEINGSLAASSIELMAQSLGLGVLYSGLFSVVANHSRYIKHRILLNRKDQVVTTLVIGYPSVRYLRTSQKEVPIVTKD